MGTMEHNRRSTRPATSPVPPRTSHHHPITPPPHHPTTPPPHHPTTRLSRHQRETPPSWQAPAQNDDKFIPIFVGVSLVGFGGLYLYETLRLAMDN